MTEEKMDSGQVKRLRKRRNYVEFVGLCVGLIGGMVLMVSALEASSYNDLEYKNKYLTNPDLPISEWGNATWTISHKQIHDEAAGFILYAVVGGVVLVGGFGLAMGGLISPSFKELHLMGCKGNEEPKYCPECGLKLSELKEKE